ncbi:unnamed protein product [Prorocentrum cordatum]|uniref:Methyltransferase n=1 Tax=Prorocentrum cordatum TaxID=2364126 RepID=A0ABN9UQS2_9DINO|nr:unnamed protein product [Polarella glacialis]
MMSTPAAGTPTAAPRRHYHRKDAACGKGGARGGAEARLQEAVLWAGGSLLLATATVLVGVLARSLLVERWTRPQRWSPSGADLWVLEQSAGSAGYFIDIGATHHAGLSNTRLLEQRGWSGVCVDPDTRPYEERGCGWVSRPIGSKGGELVDLPACGKNASSCPEGKATTIGIDDLLTLVEAPPVIDYVSISARSRGLDMLEGFPWDRHCARHWTVEHAGEPSQMTGLWSKFGAQGCRMAIGVADFWAACGCGGEPPPPASAAGRPGAVRAGGPATLTVDGKGEG